MHLESFLDEVKDKMTLDKNKSSIDDDIDKLISNRSVDIIKTDIRAEISPELQSKILIVDDE